MRRMRPTVDPEADLTDEEFIIPDRRGYALKACVEAYLAPGHELWPQAESLARRGLVEIGSGAFQWSWGTSTAPIATVTPKGRELYLACKAKWEDMGDA